MVGDKIEPLLRGLLEIWSGWDTSQFYVEKLAPAIVREDPSLRLQDNERAILTELRQAASPDEWSRLPELLTACMATVRQERDARDAAARARALSERERRERKEREAAELQEAQEEARRAEERRRAAAAAAGVAAALERRRQEAALKAQRRDAALERQRREAAIRAELAKMLQSDYLGTDEWHRKHPDAGLLTAEQLMKAKADFVQQWVHHRLGYQLDDEQAVAVAMTGSNVLVTARAGSGKTRALVSRAIFLMKHCRVEPSQLLLLAFNRKAVEEMRDRISRANNGRVPHIRTFHSLAYSLVHPEEEIVYDDPGVGALKRSRLLQGVIDEHLQDGEFGALIRKVMLEHFRSDWERIEAGGFDLSMSEFLVRRRSLPRETLAGNLVKSYGEKLIANTLFEHGITYAYERNFRWNGRNYRPDFVISENGRPGVVIEYFGLRGEPDYDEMTDEKRKYWSTKEGWTLIEVVPADITREPSEFAASFIGRLTDLGIESAPLSEEEIWEQTRERAIDFFTATLVTFVSRCRKRGLTTEALHNLLAAHVAIASTEGQFLHIAQSVYDGYLARLAATGSEDFDGLMWRASAALDAGIARFGATRKGDEGDLGRIRHVLVDEFQDFSQMFFEITAGIRRASRAAEFFCVGDDWQAINGFAGSELRFFHDFHRYFAPHQRTKISRNYRSPELVVAVGNAVMAGRGEPARPERSDKGAVLMCDLDSFEPSAIEVERHGGDVVSPALLRLLRRCLERGDDVVLIARRNRVPWYVDYRGADAEQSKDLESFLEHLRGYLPEPDRKRVSISTAHGYKGLESDAVIIVDAVEDSYPLIHPSWIFLRVFGDTVESIEDDERRLFYVAVTRAQKTLLLLTDSERASPFLQDVQKHQPISRRDWSTLRPAASLDGATLEVRVFQAYEVRDVLKGIGFRYNGTGKYWSKAVPVDSDVGGNAKASEWFRPPVKVEVLVDGEVVDTLAAD